MSHTRNSLVARIDEDQERLVKFLSDFLSIPSANPPGDTRQVCAFVSDFLKKEGVEHEVLQCDPELPNIAATFKATSAGRHLTLNGHMDVFPVNDEANWTRGPWSGAVADGCIWGRGAVDMKAGTTASIFTYLYLSRMRSQLKGKLSLTVVSDEETLGPSGARFLIEQHPHFRGDCCLNGEPSGANSVCFGEKGLLWLELRVQTKGGHGALPHLSESANKIAAKLILDLEEITTIAARDVTGRYGVPTDAHRDTHARKVARSVVLNIGQIQGGLKVNILPASCTIHVDIRVPDGLRVDEVKKKVELILSRYPQIEMIELRRSEPNSSPPDHPLYFAMRENARAVRGHEVYPAVALGASDARLWREIGIPAFVHGPVGTGMGGRDERIEIKEFMDVVKIHCLSAYDYLMGS
ncbi:succinyl-diaminopimelate desuccinylase [Bradyrhizobium sp. USDA 3686]|uniref:ArgE/DapE family deacylase n=1 Tax=Bradyrhizobium canariense TaxID=255045 RepID=UPI001958FF5E|nr:ArgE/DapE family deacylase [Bradyrhizobium canariense]MBM7487896.1 succinyl-diaminopimelate desuccinylase [Bradyrhizobium canariense]